MYVVSCFADEPSTGVVRSLADVFIMLVWYCVVIVPAQDPLSRRRMWDIISKVASERKICSVMLTSHSMEECEALCSRIGIMVDGQLKAGILLHAIFLLTYEACSATVFGKWTASEGEVWQWVFM